MKIIISEKQYKKLIKSIDEQDTATTTPSSGGQGYPEVGKWESGVSRGAANQIGLTKWSDVVGSLLKRDKGNRLK